MSEIYNGNEDLQVENIGNDLEGKTIAMCVTGGIAAIETPKIARHLRRYGAEVNCYATENALKFIGRASLEWATEKEVVVELSGLAEHICREDLVLVVPATTNTINKIFSGIADNNVTSLVASAMGMKKPIYLAPSMHLSLYQNPVLEENLGKADGYGIKIIAPRFGENKAKQATTRKVVGEIRKYFKEEYKNER